MENYTIDPLIGIIYGEYLSLGGKTPLEDVTLAEIIGLKKLWEDRGKCPIEANNELLSEEEKLGA